MEHERKSPDYDTDYFPPTRYDSAPLRLRYLVGAFDETRGFLGASRAFFLFTSA